MCYQTIKKTIQYYRMTSIMAALRGPGRGMRFYFLSRGNAIISRGNGIILRGNAIIIAMEHDSITRERSLFTREREMSLPGLRTAPTLNLRILTGEKS